MPLNSNTYWVWIVVAVLAADVIHTVANRRTIMHVKMKADQTWEYIYRRAMLRTLRRGFATMNSPLMVRPDIAQAYEPIRPGLVDICRKGKTRHATDPDIALDIEKNHFSWIAEHICKIYEMDQGECLVLAVEVGKAGLNVETARA